MFEQTEQQKKKIIRKNVCNTKHFLHSQICNTPDTYLPGSNVQTVQYNHSHVGYHHVSESWLNYRGNIKSFSSKN